MNALRQLPSLLALISLFPPSTAPAQPPSTSASGALPAMVILVRHAEKSTEPASDPTLTSAGFERAEALATELSDWKVTAIVTTQWRRCRETAAPLAAARGIAPEIIATQSGSAVEIHAKKVAEAVARHPGEVVLVVGHSNTIPAILAALGGPRLPDLADSAYDDLFLWRPAAAGGESLVRVHYGKRVGNAAPAVP